MNLHDSKKFLSLMLFSIIVLLQGVSWADVEGIIIPFYVYPTTAALQPLLAAKKLHPNVPMRVILNPNSGPGTASDPTYVAAVETLRAAGIQTAGYVYTAFDSKPISQAISEILEWQTLYGPDGIFLDAMGTDLGYYTQLTQLTKCMGMKFSIGNAGTDVDVSYANAVDTVIIATTNGLPNLQNYANWSNANLPKTHVGMILNNVKSFAPGFIYEAKKFNGWLYITDASGANPWNVLPSYFNLLMNSLDTGNVGTIFPFYIYPTATAIQPLITAAKQYTRVPMWVVLNPNSGPGTQADPTYLAAVNALRAAGITVLGYVHTSYGNRSLTVVENEISTWVNWYNPDGIFLDEMGYNHPYYNSIMKYAKNIGIQVIDANPGVVINPLAGADVDVTNIYENSMLPANFTAFQGWTSLYPPANLSIICYNIPTLSQTFVAQASKYFGWIFITDQGGNNANPYGAYPTYFNALMQALSTQD